MEPVPFIRSGVGETPADGGCWMQVIDWTQHGSWTDAPECVHPAIRAFGIAVNDRLPDDERQVLLEPRFTYRAVGTDTGDKVLTRKLLGYLARQVYPIYSTWAERSGYDDHGAVLACVEAAERGEAPEAAEAAEAPEAAEAAWAAQATKAAQATGAAAAAWAAGAAAATWAARAAAAARAAWATEAPSLLTLLTGLLDEYDRLTGRTRIEPVDLTPVCELYAQENPEALVRP